MKKIFVSSLMDYFGKCAFIFHHINFGAESKVGDDTPKMNLAPKAQAQEELFLRAHPAEIIKVIMRAPKARAKKI